MGWVGMEKEMRSVRDRNVEAGKGWGLGEELSREGGADRWDP
jgi:hypothetical protein